MKTKYNKEFDAEVWAPETPIEAVEHLLEFLENDMWYALPIELKTERKLLKYLNAHFKICIDSIKELEEEQK